MLVLEPVHYLSYMEYESSIYQGHVHNIVMPETLSAVQQYKEAAPVNTMVINFITEGWQYVDRLPFHYT